MLRTLCNLFVNQINIFIDPFLNTGKAGRYFFLVDVPHGLRDGFSDSGVSISLHAALALRFLHQRNGT